MDEIFHSRQEHDLFKFLAKDLKELGELLEGQTQAIKKVQEITGLIDGYFLESRKRTRKKDIQISLLAKGEINE